MNTVLAFADAVGEKLLYASLGFLIGFFAPLFSERIKDVRRRIALLRVVEWQLGAFIRACQWANDHEMWDSTDVETFARFIQETFLRQPDLVLAGKRAATRKALEQIYAETAGVLELLRLHRQQVTKTELPAAIGPGTYNGLISRCDDSLRILRQARWWLHLRG